MRRLRSIKPSKRILKEFLTLSLAKCIKVRGLDQDVEILANNQTAQCQESIKSTEMIDLLISFLHFREI